MDKIILHKLQNREIDHNLKYLELEALFSNKAGKLREIIESLPNGERKATATEILDWMQATFDDVLKDWNGLQEGSSLRNTLDESAKYIKSLQKRIEILTVNYEDKPGRSTH